MKYTDDYEAKLTIWARESRVHPLPKFKGIPKFTPQKFNSYAEFNQWKQALLDRIAAAGGLQWTK
ncbi:MAG: hypothetical protein ABIF71_15885 [Planctomycetota bacterium]